MSTLALRIEKHLGVPTDVGAVAILHRLADDAGVAIRGSQRLRTTIPASSDPQRVERIYLDPGRWWIEATLPSGEIIVDEVTVRPGEDKAFTLRASQHSPHEWLGWQHLMGNVEGLQSFTRTMEAGRKDPVEYARNVITQSLQAQVPDSVRELVESTLDQYLPTEPTIPRDPFAGLGDPTVRIYVRTGQATLRGRNAWTDIFNADGELGSLPCAASITAREEGIRIYHLEALADSATSERRLIPRVFTNVEWGDSRYTAFLPTPWPAPWEQRGSAEVELMVRMHPIEKSVHLGVAVLDSKFGTLPGLMTASALPKARIFVDQARGVLFDKMENWFAAAAGGYVLLATGDDEQGQEWHRWIDNLANWFPNLPDGAVLKATKYLRYSRNSKSNDAAKAFLFEAFERGIPYFSTGVAWLLDGLTIFADEDSAAKECMQLVQKVAQRLDVSQAFTVIRLSDRKKR